MSNEPRKPKHDAEIRQALADYMYSEGCSCCCRTDAHVEAKERLAKMLRVPKYKDGSGYDFYRFRTKEKSA
jgi:hypothetical protein